MPLVIPNITKITQKSDNSKKSIISVIKKKSNPMPIAIIMPILPNVGVGNESGIIPINVILLDMLVSMQNNIKINYYFIIRNTITSLRKAVSRYRWLGDTYNLGIQYCHIILAVFQNVFGVVNADLSCSKSTISMAGVIFIDDLVRMVVQPNYYIEKVILQDSRYCVKGVTAVSLYNVGGSVKW